MRPPLRAAILAIGSELLGTERLDTNSLRLTAALDRHGIELRKKAVVGDSEEELTAEVRALLTRVDLVLVTGGLGPTADDVTREAVAAALGRGLHSDPEVLAALEERFRAFVRRMPAVNRRQAEVIDGALVLPNAHGTAPGLRIDTETATIFLFPGVPHELEGMIADQLEPWLAERSGGIARSSVTLKIAGLPESEVEERIAPAYEEFGRESITILASAGEIKLIATAAGPEGERTARLAAMADRLALLAGDSVYTRNADDTLEQVVGDLLREGNARLATAESCTGGLLAERLTRIAGSSDYFPGGVVTYSNGEKTRLLGVPAEHHRLDQREPRGLGQLDVEAGDVVGPRRHDEWLGPPTQRGSLTHPQMDGRDAGAALGSREGQGGTRRPHGQLRGLADRDGQVG
ncbi:MAG TPA: CinA family nicotinamide mononucleotide deamidase-related protein, partial [Candidatus Dormibacteraeota bacterium]